MSVEKDKKAPKIWINAGEVSGDIHGGALLTALLKKNNKIQAVGMGGTELEKAGMKNLFRVEELSVMGFVEIFAKLPKIYSLLKNIKKALEVEKPDLLICIDAPSFNFRVIKIAKRLNIPVVYYISPKIWAWGAKRALFLKQNVRRILSILPFEPEFYKRFDMEIDYIGNPLVELVNFKELKDIPTLKKRIGLLPGSREKEINTLMPRFAAAAEILYKQDTKLNFHCVVAPGINPNKIQELWNKNGGLNITLTLHDSNLRYEFIRSCEFIIAASGTATLETALLQVPTIVTYVVSPLTYFLGKRFVKINYVSLPNLILNEEVFPELLQEKCLPENLAKVASVWLEDKENFQTQDSYKILTPTEVKKKLQNLALLLGDENALERAAQIIATELKL
ncbi:lipid-A-disaccharide synthase [Desulfovibrio litoralis]|uniref:Lipid-A-disaccharide synthase n=1 Tax=Desulfovibrio litoralis DSM 11393 TaxID=1121455 RepID=A0A1M7T673_9BACT|nr:lipid-A-disaccharide synthase [Desulfovibrio litoralis]SHN66233.1 lipid-A-disaccharide synthase [Desulfovibrio litoralis DSM 11393]